MLGYLILFILICFYIKLITPLLDLLLICIAIKFLIDIINFFKPPDKQ